MRLPGSRPGHSGNTKYQVSAGVKKRFSQMTPAEMDRVQAAALAELLLTAFGREFEAEATARPEWAAKIREDAAKVKALEGEMAK